MMTNNFVQLLPVCPEGAYLTDNLKFSNEPVSVNAQVVVTKILFTLTPWPFQNPIEGLQARNCIKQIQRRQFPDETAIFVGLDKLFNEKIGIHYLVGSTDETKKYIQC